MPLNKIQEERFLLDSHALERCFAEGSPQDHAKLANQTSCAVHVTSDTKADFLDAFPDDKVAVSDTCSIAPQRSEDRKLAAVFTDRLQNIPNIEDADVQDKLLVIAVARRLEATLVSGEEATIPDSLHHLADLLDAPCISTDEFLSKLK